MSSLSTMRTVIWSDATSLGTRFLVFGLITSKFGATHEVRTRDLNLGKVALYQLS